MSSRRVVILALAALAVIAGSIWLSSQRHLDRDVVVGEAVLPELKKSLDDVTELRIAKADGTHATLKKSGAEWRVHERDFIADTAKVRKLLLDLSKLEVVEGKTSDPKNYAAINVEEVPPVDPDSVPAPKPPKANPYDFTEPLSATRIDIVTAKKTWSLINGKSGGYKNGYVRVAGAKQSFLASPRLDADVEPQRWLDHTIVDIPEARVQSVAVKPAKGPSYTVSREKKEQENFTVAKLPPGRKLSYEAVANSVARGLESVSLDDLRAKPEKPAALPSNTTVELSEATFRTFDGVTVEIFGRKESAPGLKKDDPKVEKFFIALNASSGEKATQPEAEKLQHRTAGKEFEISSYKYEGLFKPLEDFLEAPSTTTKEKKKKDK